jgi:hypothetical protein
MRKRAHALSVAGYARRTVRLQGGPVGRRARARGTHGRGARVRGCFPNWLVWGYPQLTRPRELDRQQAITRGIANALALYAPWL